MTRHAVADDEARLHVERGEERSGAMTLVVMGHGGGAALLERQSGLGPIEGLDLRLLIDAEHDRPVRRIEVEPDDLGDLLLEHRVVRDLEALCQMGLQACVRPYPAHDRGRNAHRVSHRRAAPVRGIGRRFLNGLRDHLQANLPWQRRHPRGPRLVALEPWHALIEIPLLSAPDRRLRHARPPHDLDRAQTVRRRQHDIGAPGKLARRVAVAQQSLQIGAGGGAKVKADVRASHPTTMPQQRAVGYPMSDAEH